MIGAIAGDVIGSPYEGSYNDYVKEYDFPLFQRVINRFTDDTVLTCATAECILDCEELKKKKHFSKHNLHEFPKYSDYYLKWGKANPDRGYGKGFLKWMETPTSVNTSYANGCMMRCSPIPYYYKNQLHNIKVQAISSISKTHNSPESERGILAICEMINMAFLKTNKNDMVKHIQEYYGFMLDKDVDYYHKHEIKDIRCNYSAPMAITAFLYSSDYETAVRNAVYMKGDTDTHACIAGAIAEAYYGIDSIPKTIIEETKKRLDNEIIDIVNRFYQAIDTKFTL